MAFGGKPSTSKAIRKKTNGHENLSQGDALAPQRGGGNKKKDFGTKIEITPMEI